MIQVTVLLPQWNSDSYNNKCVTLEGGKNLRLLSVATLYSDIMAIWLKIALFGTLKIMADWKLCRWTKNIDKIQINV